MTDLERVLLKAFVVNTKYSSIIVQQNKAQITASTSILIALQMLLEATDKENVDNAQILRTLVDLQDATLAAMNAELDIQKDLKSINESLKSMGVDSKGLSEFEFTLN